MRSVARRCLWDVIDFFAENLRTVDKSVVVFLQVLFDDVDVCVVLVVLFQPKKRGAELDTAALVANFESGAHLTELRKQLHASQKAMEASASVVKQAARDFHGGAF